MDQFKKVNYRDLNPKQKEIYNFQKSAAKLAEYGFNCIKLTDDWLGADFLAYRSSDATTLLVQLKGRLTVKRDYIGKSLWINFPIYEHWYLIEHDVLLRILDKQIPTWSMSDSWKEGTYSAPKPSKQLIRALRPYCL